MRAVIGLGGILVALGILVWLMGFELGHDKSAIDAGKKATAEVSVIAGKDDSGVPVKQSATLEPQQTGGKIDSILVTGIVADGAYAKVWGLKRNDAIVEIGPLPVSQVVTDAGAADDFVMDAYQHSQTLTIYRDGNKMTLTPQSALTPAATPNNPSPPGSNNPLQNQLDAIQQIPTH